METTINKQSKAMFSDKTKQRIIDIVSYLFVLLFLYAASSKLMKYDTSLLQMSKSPIITDYAHILVWFVPAVEIIISILLLVNRTVLLGLYAAFVLMCLFTAYIYAILNFSDTIPCHCGGALELLSWSQHLVFNTVFIVMAVVAILLKSKTVQK
jgi:uncharacterized membrane protein YphA (DoxX/SURF4 family)